MDVGFFFLPILVVVYSTSEIKDTSKVYVFHLDIILKRKTPIK